MRSLSEVAPALAVKLDATQKEAVAIKVKLNNKIPPGKREKLLYRLLVLEEKSAQLTRAIQTHI